MAFRDGLTSLPSRRAFDEAVGKLSGRYAIAMVDIDHFKAVNDQYGHDVGDQVLRMVAARLAAVRGGARAYRIGGEEFALVFAKRGTGDVLGELESLRAAVAGSGFVLRSPERPARKPKRATAKRAPETKITVTISIGVAERAGASPRRRTSSRRPTTPSTARSGGDATASAARRGPAGRERHAAGCYPLRLDPRPPQGRPGSAPESDAEARAAGRGLETA